MYQIQADALKIWHCKLETLCWYIGQHMHQKVSIQYISMWELGSSPRQRITKRKNGFLHGVANNLSLLQVHLNKRLYTLFSIKLQNSYWRGFRLGSQVCLLSLNFFVHATACTCFIFQHLVTINFCKFNSWVWLPDIESGASSGRSAYTATPEFCRCSSLSYRCDSWRSSTLQLFKKN